MNLFNMLKTMIERSIANGEDLVHYYTKLENYKRFNQITQEQYDELKTMLDNAQVPSEV